MNAFCIINSRDMSSEERKEMCRKPEVLSDLLYGDNILHQIKLYHIIRGW